MVLAAFLVGFLLLWDLELRWRMSGLGFDHDRDSPFSRSPRNRQSCCAAQPRIHGRFSRCHSPFYRQACTACWRRCWSRSRRGGLVRDGWVTLVQGRAGTSPHPPSRKRCGIVDRMRRAGDGNEGPAPRAPRGICGQMKRIGFFFPESAAGDPWAMDLCQWEEPGDKVRVLFAELAGDEFGGGAGAVLRRPAGCGPGLGCNRRPPSGRAADGGHGTYISQAVRISFKPGGFVTCPCPGAGAFWRHEVEMGPGKTQLTCRKRRKVPSAAC